MSWWQTDPKVPLPLCVKAPRTKISGLVMSPCARVRGGNMSFGLFGLKYMFLLKFNSFRVACSLALGATAGAESGLQRAAADDASVVLK
jgi:hypothetical protein